MTEIATYIFYDLMEKKYYWIINIRWYYTLEIAHMRKFKYLSICLSYNINATLVQIIVKQSVKSVLRGHPWNKEHVVLKEVQFI